jgi:two-component system, NarL family, nitrate/nitrite sensor histidine kinase NarX
MNPWRIVSLFVCQSARRFNLCKNLLLPYTENFKEHFLSVPKEKINSSKSAYVGEMWKLLEGFLGTIVKSVDARAGSVRVLSANGRELHTVGAVGLPDEAFDYEFNVDVGCGVCGKSARDNEIHSSDTVLCAGHSGSQFFSDDCKHVVAIPLEYQGDLIGVLTLFFATPQDVPADSSRIFRSFAELVGIALENTKQNSEARRINLMAERQYIASEIHDSLAQKLVYTRMRMSLLLQALQTGEEKLALKCANDVDETLETSQKTVRDLITHFRFQMDPQGLHYALQDLINESRERTKINLEYSNRVANYDLPLEYELQIFQIVREALNNIVKHSGATHASVYARHLKERFLFTIEDNGCGTCAPIEGHYGLLIMRERAKLINGEVDVKSISGSGTRVRLEFPDPQTTMGHQA